MRLAIGPATIPAGGSIVLFTVPTDRTAILKDVRGYVVTAASAPSLQWDAGGGNLGTIWRGLAAAGAFVLPPETWCVGLEGDELRYFGSPGDQIYWLISGTLLDGDPA